MQKVVYSVSKTSIKYKNIPLTVFKFDIIGICYISTDFAIGFQIL